MAEVWLLLATEKVWWVIFALLMLVGRRCGRCSACLYIGSVCLADSNGFLPSARRARRRTGVSEWRITRAGIASTCGEMGSQGRLWQTALAMHFQRLYDSGMPLRF